MDPSAAAAPTGFVGWIMANGQIVAFVGQLVFWLILSVASLWAATTFHRYVSFMTRDTTSDKTPTAEETVSVEEFVE